MLPLVPLALPAEFVRKYAIDLAAPYTAGWSFDHKDAAFAPDGAMYVLSRVWRYKPGGEEAADPADRSLSVWLVSRYAEDGDETPSAVGVFETRRKYSKYGDAWELRLAVLPDGTVALSGHYDTTYLVDAELSEVIGSLGMDCGRRRTGAHPGGNPFATRIRVTPGGRLLCVLAEYGTRGYGDFSENLVGVADGPLTPVDRPVVEVFAAVDAAPKHQNAQFDVRSYAMFQGLPVGMGHRPARGLGELVDERWPDRFGYAPHWLGEPEPLRDDLFVVPVFGKLYRSGNRGNQFAFALLDDKGNLLGRMEGMEPWKDSPFTGECYRVATDPARGRVFHLNRYGLFAWSADGALSARVGTDAKPFSLLKNFSLLGCSPDGELVLVQDKQNLLVRVPVPEGDLATEWAPAIEAALARVAKERTALKKRWQQVAWHWTYEPEPGRLRSL